MKSDYVIVSVKLCLHAVNVGNKECITLCNFGSRIMGLFEIIEGALEVSSRHCSKQKISPSEFCLA